MVPAGNATEKTVTDLAARMDAGDIIIDGGNSYFKDDARRALALREELVRFGIDPNRVDTISYGEDKPTAMGHDESAWKQNRRGEFIELTAPK